MALNMVFYPNGEWQLATGPTPREANAAWGVKIDAKGREYQSETKCIGILKVQKGTISMAIIDRRFQ
jgi:hypothetical protein